MDFDAIADELYGLAPDEFTEARNARAKQARADKDRALATRISALRKPTMAAWVTNALVRSHRDEVELLLDLGRELRDVMADIEGDELRELTRQRYQLVSALVQQARSLAQSRGKRLTEEVAQAVRTTLEATLSDEASADAVARGRLTEGLEVSGFSTPQSGATRPRASRQSPESSAGAEVADLEEERNRRARAQAERDVAAAEKAAQRAGVAVERAQQRLDSTEREREEASLSVDRLTAQLDAARTELSRLGEKADKARSESADAQQRAHEAEDELEQARTRLDELSG